VRKILVTAALTGALLGGSLLGVSAQDGIVIQNNGVDSSQSSAGADNVNISEAAGNSASNNGSGANNEVRTIDREERTRDRKDRSERTVDEVADTSSESGEWVAEDTGTYDAYAEEGTDWTEPVAAPVELAAEVQPAPDTSGNLPIQLPNTGAGSAGAIPLAAFAAGMLSAAFGSMSWRRRLNS
jgi:LPXTG-motif cell wall-anchored protein